MAMRKIKATSHVTLAFTGVIEIDEDEYLEWLGGDEDAPERAREFIVSSPDSETDAHTAIHHASGVKDLWDASVYDSEIYEVEFIEAAP